VDGRNRVVREAGLHDRFVQVFQSYRESPADLRIRSEQEDANLAPWVAQQLK
jgi:hypothetical protein